MALRKVLLVDDSRIDHFLAIQMFRAQSPDVQITSAYDGNEALELLESQGCFDVILLDVNMPGLDGFGFLEKYTARYPDVVTPVVMLTTSSHANDIERSRAFSCVHSYQSKPLRPALIELLQNVLA